MVLRYGNVTILDSYLFFNTKLSNLPHCMSIEEHDLEKGFHPYLFTDLDYVGDIVDKRFFDMSSMHDETLARFEKWYDGWNGKEYIFKDQLYQYCKMNVQILRECCLKFSKIINEQVKEI